MSLGAILPRCNYVLDHDIEKRLYKELDGLSVVDSYQIVEIKTMLKPIKGRENKNIGFEAISINGNRYSMFAEFDKTVGKYYHLHCLSIELEMGRNYEIIYNSIGELKQLIVNCVILLFLIDGIALLIIRKKENMTVNYTI